jgi:hypothetical protein
LYRKHNAQQTNKEENIRYFSDKTALKFWYRLLARNTNFFNVSSEKSLAEQNKHLAESFSKIAIKAINYYFPHYDTGLEILKYAQELSGTEERRKHIEEMENNIPILLQHKYKSNLRLSEEEKKLLKQNALKE